MLSWLKEDVRVKDVAFGFLLIDKIVCIMFDWKHIENFIDN